MNERQATPQAINRAPEAVEVACMLGDSIVAVSHLEKSDDAPSRKSSLMWMLTGGIFLLISAFAFAKGVAVAAANKAALQEWTEVFEISASEFRGQELPLVYDYLAFVGLGVGLAAIFFGLFRLRARRAKSEFTVGTAAEVDFAAEIPGAESVSMVRTNDAGAVVSVAPGMTAELLMGPVAVSLEQLSSDGRARPSAAVAGGYDIDLTHDASIRLGAGQASFFVRPSTAQQTRVGAFASRLNGRTASFFMGSALAHVAVLLMLNWVPPTTRSLSVDAGSSSARHTMVVSKVPEDEIQPDLDGTSASDESDTSGNQTAAPGEHGLAGNDSSADKGKTQIAKRADKPQMSRAQAIDYAQKQGIAGAIKADYFRHLVGTADFSSGEHDIDTWGRNGRDGSSAGDFGHSRFRGPGPGAGGNNGTISTDDSDYYKPGATDDGGRIGPKDRDSKGPQVEISVPDTFGDGLDKETIRRYIKRKKAQLRHAYEKALLVSPELHGTVTVVFVINAQGLVVEAKAKGMANAAMMSQVESIFESIKFPRLKSGGILRVVYPINYKRAG